MGSLRPERADNVARMVQGFRSFCRQACDPHSFSRHIITSFESLVGVEDPLILLNLWRHPLLEAKYKDVVRRIRILKQPANIISSTATKGPALAWRSLGIFTLQFGGGADPAPELTDWTHNLRLRGR